MYLIFASCKDDKDLHILSEENEILLFDLLNIKCDIQINDSIILVYPSEKIDLTHLTPIIKTSPKAEVIPESLVPQDFSKIQKYFVKSENGRTKSYYVEVKYLTKPWILNFSFLNPTTKGIIKNDTILVIVPLETNLSSLIPIIKTTPNTSINPKSGDLQDFTKNVNYVLTDSSGNIHNYTVIVKKSPWERITNKALFSARDGMGGLVFNNKLWLFGGWTGEFTNSQVYSSQDGLTWELVNAQAEWPSRHCAGYAVFKNKMWVISGDGCKDVWSSDDGVTWTCMNSNAPWGARYSPYVVSFNNKLWLMGGQWYSPENWQRNDPSYTTIGFNDVWSSEDGINWVLEVPNAPWSPRSLIQGSVVFNNKVWIMGGGLKGVLPYNGYSETIVEYNDVWSSSDCIHWEKVVDNAEWEPRTHFSIATFDEKIFITDGSVKSQSNMSNEVWYSSDGKNWKELKGTFWPVRHASRLVPFGDDLFLISGYFYNDIWKMSKNNFHEFIK